VKLVVRSWNGLVLLRHLYDSTSLAEKCSSGWRFCRKVIKDAQILLTSFVFVCVPSFHYRINVLITFGMTLGYSN
jgi:hypothetical protein